MWLVPESGLFHEARRGDSVARRQLLGRYRPLLRLVAARHARKVVRHRFDESDVVQVAFAEALQSFASFRGHTQEELCIWLERILENSLVRLWRRNAAAKRDYRREVFCGDRSGSLSFVWSTRTPEDPARNLIQGEVALILAQALQQLPNEYRETLELRYIDGRRIRDVAFAMNTTTGVVAGRLRGGLQMLRELLPAELRDLLEGGCE